MTFCYLRRHSRMVCCKLPATNLQVQREVGTDIFYVYTYLRNARVWYTNLYKKICVAVGTPYTQVLRYEY